MAVVSSGTAQDSKGFKLVTGFLKVKDILINPTLEELNAYGVAFKEAPNYLIDDDVRGKGVVITIWMKLDENNFSEKDRDCANQQISQRFYLYNTPKVAQSGKKQYVNKFGVFAYADDIDSTPSFFNEAGVREAYVGEEELTNFIKAWGDIRKNDECRLDTIPEICNGNFQELKSLEMFWDTHKLKVLVGLKDIGDNKFVPVVYNKTYWRVYSETIGVKENDAWVQKPYQTGLKWFLEQPYQEFSKADILSFEPKVWASSDLKSTQPTPDSEFVSAPSDGDDLF